MRPIGVVETISKNIHNIRIEKNISLQELADRAGIEVETIRKLGSGIVVGGMGPPLYAKIAKALGVNVRELMKGLTLVED